jgi:hypothetical protein
MKTDPILAELHATREKILAEAGGTIEGLMAKLREDQAKSGRTVIKNVDELLASRKDNTNSAHVESLSSPASSS